jgi:hypothetical protein
MATVVHNNFRNAQMGAPANSTTTVDFPSDDIDLALLDATDSGAIDETTENYGQVDGATVVADRSDSAEIPLGSKTVGSVSTGVFDAANPTFNSITGDDADYLVLYKFDATPANATLIVTWDSATSGLPVSPNGGDIIVTLNASGVVQI